jgi:glutathione S-transferase
MITIHGVFGSPFVRALRIALEEKGLPWAWAPFALGQHKEEPYLSLHPFGKIPAITDDGFCLYETQAMLRYIDRKAAEPALMPADPQRAARADQIMAIADNYLWPCGRGIGFNRVIAPRIGVPVDEQAVADSVAPTAVALAALAKLLGTQDFMTGDRLTLADISVLPMLDMLSLTPEGSEILAAHPAILAWLGRMRERPSVRNSAKPPEKVLAAA